MRSGYGLLSLLTIVVAGAGGATTALAQSGERSGKETVQAVCSRCHASGANGAPKIGDKAAWRPRASQGLTSLTKHALEGLRKMPSHGGNPSLSDLEIARAVTYMVNQSGGKWVEPVSVTDLAAEHRGEAVAKAPRGGKADLTDNEVRSAIIFMFNAPGAS